MLSILTSHDVNIKIRKMWPKNTKNCTKVYYAKKELDQFDASNFLLNGKLSIFIEFFIFLVVIYDCDVSYIDIFCLSGHIVETDWMFCFCMLSKSLCINKISVTNLTIVRIIIIFLWSWLGFKIIIDPSFLNL